MATYREKLAAIEAAIDGLLTGEIQSYQFANRLVTKINIAWLLQEQKRLEPLAARERQTGGGIRQRAGYLVR